MEVCWQSHLSCKNEDEWKISLRTPLNKATDNGDPQGEGNIKNKSHVEERVKRYDIFHFQEALLRHHGNNPLSKHQQYKSSERSIEDRS